MFCGTDRMAMGAYDYLKETGRRIPQDVGVAGFDNQLLIVAQVRPALTTIAQPHYEMRKQAVQLALSHAMDAESRHAALPPPGRPEHGRGLCAHDIAATKTKPRSTDVFSCLSVFKQVSALIGTVGDCTW